MIKGVIRKFFIIFFLLSIPLFAGDFHVEDQPQIIGHIVQLEQKGILKQKPNGYVYVEVSPQFIADTLPLLNVPGKIVPPRHYTSKKGIGAHISVMYENELIENEIWEIQELGQEFTFAIKEIRTVKINRDNKLKKLWLIAVEAPDLERIRENYGLSSKLKGHDFHITIGSQVPDNSQRIFILEEDEAA